MKDKQYTLKGEIMAIYYFNPDELSPDDIAEILGLQLVKDPGPSLQLLFHGTPVGYFVRMGGQDEEKGFQHGAIALNDEMGIPEGFEGFRT